VVLGVFPLVRSKEDGMDRDFEKRFLFTMVIFVLFSGFYIYLFNSKAAGKRPATPVSSEELVSNTLQVAVPVSVKGEKSFPLTQVVLSNQELSLLVGSKGPGVVSLAMTGKWNQSDKPIEVVFPREGNHGAIQWERNSSEGVDFQLVKSDPYETEWAATLLWNTTSLDVRVRFVLLSNYTFAEIISLSNRANQAVKLDYEGRSFVIRWMPMLIDTNSIGSGNLLTYGAYAGKRFYSLLKKGLFSPAQNVAFVSNFQWLSMADNYFAFVVEPKTPGIVADFTVEGRYKTVEETAIHLFLPVLFLNAGESTNFTVQYYCGPRKESLLRSVNSSYKELFRWPLLFAWFMKPIEWGLSWLLDILGSLIANKGIVIVLIALIVKLLLSPLSIQAAISVKKQQLLQPKLKNIQEKYKDNQELLQKKTMELYKKEKINPLGGCFPLLLQIPVFFALYRVLSYSVELKNAAFLWIKDLTQPDTLFVMNIPLLPHNFNLLPIVMTVIQLIQTKLQTAKNPAMKGQELNMYLLPLIFLFLFWNMPSGLVLYWTIQNLYTIVEQEIINLDKKIKP